MSKINCVLSLCGQEKNELFSDTFNNRLLRNMLANTRLLLCCSPVSS